MKKRNLIKSLIFGLFLLSTLCFAAAPPNAGFESWTSDNADSWVKDTNIEDYQEATIIHSGSYSAKLTFTSTDQATCDYTSDFVTGFTITPGTDYTATIYAYDNDAAGQGRVAITWFDAANVSLSNSYGAAYTADSTNWQKMTCTATAPANAAKAKVYFRGYDITSTWDGDCTIYIDDVSFDVAGAATEVANIAAARNETTGAIKITGTVTLVSDISGLDSYGKSFAVQDNSGTDGQSAIIIVDPNNKISNTTGYTVGATLTNITGDRGAYHGTEQITLTADPGTPGTGTAPSPKVVTLPIADINAIEAELIRINNVQTSSTGNFSINTSYPFEKVGSPSDTITVRIEEGSTLAGTALPTGAVDFIGIAYQFDTENQIQPRYNTDMITNSEVKVWNLY